MFIRQTRKQYKGKAYSNYLLVESVATPKGPRQRTICSLGDLSPGPPKKWHDLARRLEASLAGQLSLDESDPQVEALTAKVRAAGAGPPPAGEDIVAVHADQVRVEHARESGPVHVGHQMWLRLDMDEILEQAGLDAKARCLTEVMTLNRLVAPSSEHAMPDWVRTTALSDLLGVDFSALGDEALYRNLDRLHPQRGAIEAALAEREKNLFNLDDTYLLYDLTSTYFEGQAKLNPKAKRGYSRDHRPDCKQVVVGLVLDRDGFPKAHEIFEGNRQDRASLEDMLDVLEKRTGRHGGGTVIVDRGMAHDDNLQQIRDRGHHYLVAARQSERKRWEKKFNEDGGWQEVIRQPSPTNPAQKKPRVWIRRAEHEGELHVLCKSEGRVEKDRAIREKQENRLLADLAKLKIRIAEGRLIETDKVNQAIGRLRERYSRVGRYYDTEYSDKSGQLSWSEKTEAKKRAADLDGCYLLRTSRLDLDEDEAWRLYSLLTRAENAFRDLKSPLSERPIFHQLERRVETHIFLCILAYHLLIAIEKTFLDHGLHTSWETLRQQLSTHQVVTVVLPTTDGRRLEIRRGTTPEPKHRQIYDVLGFPHEVMTPKKAWL